MKKKPGRPATHNSPLIPRAVSATADQWAKANRIGDGVTAEGVRRAIDAYKDKEAPEQPNVVPVEA